jgi:hypothetical protein
MTYAPDVPAPGSTSRYAVDEVVLYGIKLNIDDDFATLDLTQRPDFGPSPSIVVLRMQLWQKVKAQPYKPFPRDEVTIAAVYGYSVQGHCFRPDKARIYAFYYDGDALPAVGCGFDEAAGAGAPNSYRMWRLNAKSPLMELSASIDTVEALVLEANLPGKRAPNAYESRMELGHRGGRLKT